MHLMRTAFLIAACGAATMAGAQSSRRAPDISWGKPGVSLEDYRADANGCAQEAVNLDISGTEPVERLIAASRSLQTVVDSFDMWGSAADYARTRDRYQPDRQLDRIAALQQEALDACLIRRGYRQFRLTDEQKRRLRSLERGSDERRAYLHSLGSSAEVLQQQAI